MPPFTALNSIAESIFWPNCVLPDFVMSGLFTGSVNFDLVTTVSFGISLTKSTPSTLFGAVVYGWKQSLP